MALTLRFSAFATALAWLPAALAQVNPPLTDSVTARTTVSAPISAPVPAPSRAALRDASAAPPAGVAQTLPVVAGAPAPASAHGVSDHPPAAETARIGPAEPRALTPVSPAAATSAEGPAYPPNPAGSVVQTAVAAGAVTPATPAKRAPRLAGGEATRGLMAVQASASAAGPARPVLGPAATAAWDRYLESFTHPIPERFEQTVERSQQ